MQIIIDTGEQCAVAFYPEDINSVILFDFSSLVNERMVYSEIIQILSVMLINSAFCRTNGFCDKRFQFWRFVDCVIVTVYADKKHNLLADEALSLKKAVMKLESEKIRCFNADSLQNISLFAKSTKYTIDKLYKCGDRYFFTAKERIPKETVNEFLIETSAMFIPVCISGLSKIRITLFGQKKAA